MKSFISLSFILLQLFTTTQMGELFKLPALVAHYFEHDEKDDHQPFFAFIKEHYAELHATESQMHSDHHKRLPFKTIDINLFSLQTAALTSVYSSEGLSAAPSSSVKRDNINSPAYFCFVAKIWQPPRALKLASSLI
jgi:hypothetical protein